ncbi:hypothetical protein RRG08_030686 [Elysia crispata]|uniref:Uncharacterized protein n=1 Tax=Elysia crispata TaxID=231223 RepID=A0AAE0Y5A0_9GAST|nr:hypothetical protein RRG08_030686 [Elysia crispata]
MTKKSTKRGTPNGGQTVPVCGVAHTTTSGQVSRLLGWTPGTGAKTSASGAVTMATVAVHWFGCVPRDSGCRLEEY